MKYPAQYPPLPSSRLILDPKTGQLRPNTTGTEILPPQQWTIETGVEIRTSHRFRLMIGMLIMFTICGMLLFHRIRNLEKQNDLLQSQLDSIHITLNEILLHVSTDVDNQDSALVTSDEEPNVPNFRNSNRVKRSGSTENIPNDSSNYTSSSNATRVPDSLTSRIRNVRKLRERERGKWRKVSGDLKKLKLKVKQICKSGGCTASSHFSNTTAKLSSPSSDARAVYLVPTGNNVNIEERGQLIGPWYIARNGHEYGFNDLWYEDISLDDNGTSVIFQESGLHLIYAQVYYHLTLGHNEKPAPMGFRIYIRKNPLSQNPVFQRPIPIAECVPSYPATFYQTCFTQVAWFMDRGDRIYLEHFTRALPMIEADKQGKTFLGIVRLSGPN